MVLLVLLSRKKGVLWHTPCKSHKIDRKIDSLDKYQQSKRML